MNFKKALSLLSAAAMAASCFSGVIAASAKEATAKIGQIYNADEICDASEIPKRLYQIKTKRIIMIPWERRSVTLKIWRTIPSSQVQELVRHGKAA